MARRIREEDVMPLGITAAAIPLGQADGYLDKVIKYVPADVIAAWAAVVAIIKAAGGIPSGAVMLICAAIGLALTFWWTLKSTDAPGQPLAIKQAIVATVAFLVWVLALGDLDTALAGVIAWNDAYAKLLLVAFTLVSGKV